MNYHITRDQIKNIKAVSDARGFITENRQFQDMFPEPIIEEKDEINYALNSEGDVQSFSESSSSSSSEEEKKMESDDPLKSKPKMKKLNYRNSILKSKLLTNKRQSFIKNSFDKKGSNKLRKFSTDVEGRLPIRRPSGINKMLDLPNFNPKINKVTSFNINNEELDDEAKEQENDELDNTELHESGDKEALESFLSRSLFSNKFQVVWATTLFVAHTYHLLAIFWYLSFSDFPKTELLFFQIMFEFILVIDIILRI